MSMNESSEQSKIVVPFIEMIVTTMCNLNCKNCSNLIPEYGNNRATINFQDYVTHLDCLLHGLDELTYFKIHGGEPLMLPDIDKYVAYACLREKISNVIIPTNGTYVPQKSVLRKLSQYAAKATIVISNYPAWKEMRGQLITQLESAQVAWSLSKEKLWYEFGEIYKHGYSEDELQKRYLECRMRKYTSYYMGCLFPCSRAANAVFQKSIPADPEEEYNLLSCISICECREKVKSFFKKRSSTYCDFCDMNNCRCQSPALQFCEG